MRPIKFIAFFIALLMLSACMSGSTKSSVKNSTVVSDTFTVGSDGKVAYVGTGSFDGVTMAGTVSALAGKTITITKTDAAYSVSGYAALSSLYTVTVAGVSGSTSLNNLAVTIPFSGTQMTTAGKSVSDIVFCSMAGGTPVEYDTTHGSGYDVTATVSVPGSFMAAYKQTNPSASSGLIKLQSESYQSAIDAGDTLTDKNSNVTADTIRGTNHVQIGEKVKLGINEVVFGDTVQTVAWTLTDKPSGSSAAITHSGSNYILIPDVIGTYTVQAVATGTTGIKSTATANVYALNYSYDSGLGNSTCFIMCHSGIGSLTDKYGRNLLRDLTTPWSNTAHANAGTAVASSTDTRCLACHATGYKFADRNGDGVDEYYTASGYDDTITNWAAPATSGAAYLRKVSCEACHGPGQTTGSFISSHYSGTTVDSGVCRSCHEFNSHTGQYFEYSEAHDNSYKLSNGVVSKNASCFKCHTGEGAMAKIYSANVTPANTTTVTGIGCAVCHDPHGESGLTNQLRISGNYTFTLSSGTATAAANKSRVCYNCHNSDTTLPAVGSSLHNTQAEMTAGVGGYTYGQMLTTADTASSHTTNGLTCGDCHMKRTAGTTHQMLMTENTADRLTYCSTSCHTGTSPVYTSGHYDSVTGSMATLRTKLASLKTAINTKAGYAADTTIKASYSVGTTALNTALNRAAYNYNFILSDKSSGFHNPTYAEKLIDLSLSDLAAY